MIRRTTETVGGGISEHQRSRLIVDGPVTNSEAQEIADALKAAASRNAPWAWLEREKGIAERTLAAIDAGERGMDGDRIFEPHHGAGWYSKEILQRVCWIESARDQGDMERAARMSAELSELATTIRLKKWDRAARSGMRMLDPFDEWRNEPNRIREREAADRHAEYQRAADPVWERNPEFSNMAVAKIISEKFPDAKVGTIRRAIRRPS